MRIELYALRLTAVCCLRYPLCGVTLELELPHTMGTAGNIVLPSSLNADNPYIHACLIKRVIHFVAVNNSNSKFRGVLDGGPVGKRRMDGSYHMTKGSVRYKRNSLVERLKKQCVGREIR